MRESRILRVLLVLSEKENMNVWVSFAAAIAGSPAEIHLRGLVNVPAEKSLSEGVIPARAWRDTLYKAAREREDVHDVVNVFVDYAPMTHIQDELSTRSFDLLVVQWAGPMMTTGGFETEQILQSVNCDVVLLCGENWKASGPVLLSLRGGPNLSLGLRTAKALAGTFSITVFNAASSSFSVPDMAAIARADPQVTRTVTVVSDVIGGIMRELPEHKAIVMGAALAGSSQMLKQVYEQSKCPIAVVRARVPEALEFHAPRPLWREETAAAASNRVDRWFAENTYHSHEFSDLKALVALKEKQGVSISVGLPALNEEATVGKVIGVLKSALMDDVPLVDEIILMDSNSTDNTAAIAESLGIPVYRHPEVLVEHVGTYAGKGEALWKSLYVLKGDIIAWVDTDITNIHPRFIYGLLGPLLKQPQVQYVKGFYQRPIQVGNKLQAYGGGRVTELVVRPLFNLFYPELSGLIQPLSGEYAGRRSALEQVPFFSGYGVETGLLLDVLDRFGLDAIAQTDLEVRVHHNQPLVGLSKMAFAILQVVIARLETRYGIQLLDKANQSMKLIVQEPDRFALDIAAIGDFERPPMLTLDVYRREHHPY